MIPYYEMKICFGNSAALYFLLRMKFGFLLLENHAGGRLRHAFIGIGFRERTEAYDFQAALHDHMKYPQSNLFY